MEFVAICATFMHFCTYFVHIYAQYVYQLCTNTNKKWSKYLIEKQWSVDSILTSLQLLYNFFQL